MKISVVISNMWTIPLKTDLGLRQEKTYIEEPQQVLYSDAQVLPRRTRQGFPSTWPAYPGAVGTWQVHPQSEAYLSRC